MKGSPCQTVGNSNFLYIVHTLELMKRYFGFALFDFSLNSHNFFGKQNFRLYI